MKILIGGDISFGRIFEGQEIHYGKDGCLSDLALVPRDYAVFNLESPLSSKPRIPKPTGAHLYGELEDVRHLLDSEVDYVSLANNHSLDCGVKGIDETIKTLDFVGIAHSGSGEDYLSPHIDHQNKLIIFSIDTVKDEYCLVDPVCCRPNFEKLTSVEIPRYREAYPSYLIVCCIHWGDEYVMPTDQQKHLGRVLVNSGVDMVVGNHPHVLQPMEVYRGKPIFYSLGNLYFTHHAPENDGRQDTHLGCLSLVEFNGRDYVQHINYPTWITSGVKVSLL
jgi:poly-gamma-glutamate synthesis protein (capsule biosynthesis protein)